MIDKKNIILSVVLHYISDIFNVILCCKVTYYVSILKMFLINNMCTKYEFKELHQKIDTNLLFLYLEN